MNYRYKSLFHWTTFSSILLVLLLLLSVSSMPANQSGDSSANMSFDSVGNASIDSGALADISSISRASVSSANSNVKSFLSQFRQVSCMLKRRSRIEDYMVCYQRENRASTFPCEGGKKSSIFPEVILDLT